MNEECLYPKDNDGLCRQKAVMKVTRVNDNEPNLTVPMCEEHMNQVLGQYNIEVEEI